MGPYRVRRALAAGTLGPTLLVNDEGGQATLALKLITTVSGDDAVSLGAALAATATLGVSHSGLLPVLATGIDPAGVYLVSPFVDAPTLETRLRSGRQPLAQVLEWLAGPAAALDLAHQEQRYHGAIHPRDILLPRGRGVLTGLDISPALEALGLQAPVRVPFTAPERASGKPWNARADQYSLAMLALDALSGRRLIAGTIPAFDRWTLADTPTEDARLHEVFARSLHPDPDQRFPSVAAWIAALAGAAEPGSELSRFARHGVIPAAAPDARRASTPEVTDEAKPRALFPPDDPSPATVEAPATPVGRTPGKAGHVAPTQSPTGEWLVASMPEDAPPLVDTAPLPIQSVTPVDAADVEPAPPVAAASDDFALRDVGDEKDARDVQDRRDDVWSETDELAEESSRRGGLVLAIALVMVALIAFGTWRSLRGPDAPDPAAGTTRADDTAQPVEDPQGLAKAPAPVTEEALRPSEEELAPGAPPPSDATTVDVPAADAPAVAALDTPPAAAPARVPRPAARSTPAAPAGQPSEAPLSLDRARILIRSSPAGQVRVNGRPRGETPVVLRDLPFGSYVITVSRAGYLDAVREVDVLPSQPVASISVDLQRQTGAPGAAPVTAPVVTEPLPAPPPREATGVGSLYIVSSPPDGRLFIDGQPFGTAPAVVPGLRAGRHVVRVEMPGYRAFERTVDVLAGQRLRVDATLVQEPR